MSRLAYKSLFSVSNLKCK